MWFSKGKFSGMVQAWTWGRVRLSQVNTKKWKKHRGVEGTCQGVIIMTDHGI